MPPVIRNNRSSSQASGSSNPAVEVGKDVPPAVGQGADVRKKARDDGGAILTNGGRPSLPDSDSDGSGPRSGNSPSEGERNPLSDAESPESDQGEEYSPADRARRKRRERKKNEERVLSLVVAIAHPNKLPPGGTRITMPQKSKVKWPEQIHVTRSLLLAALEFEKVRKPFYQSTSLRAAKNGDWQAILWKGFCKTVQGEASFKATEDTPAVTQQVIDIFASKPGSTDHNNGVKLASVVNDGLVTLYSLLDPIPSGISDLAEWAESKRPKDLGRVTDLRELLVVLEHIDTLKKDHQEILEGTRSEKVSEAAAKEERKRVAGMHIVRPVQPSDQRSAKRSRSRSISQSSVPSASVGMAILNHLNVDALQNQAQNLHDLYKTVVKTDPDAARQVLAQVLEINKVLFSAVRGQGVGPAESRSAERGNQGGSASRASPTARSPSPDQQSQSE